MAPTSIEGTENSYSLSQLPHPPEALIYGPKFVARDVDVGLFFILYQLIGSQAIIRKYCNPSDCFITIDPSTMTFDAFKEAVISPISQVDNGMVNAIRADLASAAPRIQWSVGITNNKAALFCHPVVMPTEHDLMFKQWIWGINITTSGLLNVDILLNVITVLSCWADLHSRLCQTGNDPNQEPTRDASGVSAGQSPTDNEANRPADSVTQFYSKRRPSTPPPLTDFFVYCYVCDHVVQNCLMNVMVEQYIDRYKLLASPVVIQALESPRYQIPSGLIAILSSN
ncbi:hypothetical protein PSHT_06209 [Puccinia striiformis]|uniref:Uncharacterized protein n=1 Tax=Puccinia striiformis TaxID=27350 RepID=A0A2S4W8P8_9BASI|nr:hypothetical protein PSHT_06209 [Puccinia striiformis]